MAQYQYYGYNYKVLHYIHVHVHRCHILVYRNRFDQILAENRRFDQNRGHSLLPFFSSLEGATELKFAPFCYS